jgi:erythronate-4-phosphate dehydrogenase
MASEDFFEKIQPGTFCINASRGEVVDERALLRHRPKLGPLVLDTWCNEPTPNPILIDTCDVATPHIAGYSYQGKQNGTAMAVQAVARHFGIEPLYDFRPALEDESLQPVEIDLDGKTQGELWSPLPPCRLNLFYQYYLLPRPYFLLNLSIRPLAAAVFCVPV